LFVLESKPKVREPFVMESDALPQVMAAAATILARAFQSGADVSVAAMDHQPPGTAKVS
jgi:hypothetical protein